MTSEFDVVVIGAGLAGLTAGATASAGGASAVVLEAHQPGGRARTTRRRGFLLNQGGHALYAGGEGTTVLRSLGIEPIGAKPPLERYQLVLDGEVHLMPSSATMHRTRALAGRSKIQLERLFWQVAHLDPTELAPISVNSWLAANELRPDAEKVARAIIRLSTYCSDFAELSADAAVAQLQIAAKGGVLYLDGGWGQLVTALARLVQVRPVAAVRCIDDAGPAGFVVYTDNDPLRAKTVIVATGIPSAVRKLLPDAPEWSGLGAPVTAACLDVGVRRQPEPGWVLSADEPAYVSRQSIPTRHPAGGQAVMAVTRFGARSSAMDRPDCEAHLRRSGVRDEDIVTSRFLARMVVMGAAPSPTAGGRPGRPAVDDTGTPGLFIAGDWVGPDGLLADTAIASGKAAALGALRHCRNSATAA